MSKAGGRPGVCTLCSIRPHSIQDQRRHWRILTLNSRMPAKLDGCEYSSVKLPTAAVRTIASCTDRQQQETLRDRASTCLVLVGPRMSCHAHLPGSWPWRPASKSAATQNSRPSAMGHHVCQQKLVPRPATYPVTECPAQVLEVGIRKEGGGCNLDPLAKRGNH
jgi:hypothetical protein